MRNITITPGGPLKGEIRVPGDKSISHRAVMLGSVAEGVSRVSNFLTGEDSVNTARAFAGMGVEIEGVGGSELTVRGRGLRGLKKPDAPLDLGNSGTSMRLLAGLLSAQGFGCTLTGDEYLRRRPMDRVVRPLTLMGARLSGQGEKNCPPLTIDPAPPEGLKGIDYVSPIASAQVKSAVLLAGLYASGETKVFEPMKSRDHTERMVRYMGAEVKEDGLKVSVRGGQRLEARDFSVPGDISSAAFFMVAAAVVPGSRLVIRDVGVNPTRTGIIDILRLMNAAITIEDPRGDGPEPVADIVVEHSELSGIEIGGELFLRAIDEFPVICIAAAAAKGVTVIKDAAELRVKESDRIAAMAGELRKAGVRVEEEPDGLVIEGGWPVKSAVVDSHGDHRVAMSMAVAGLIAEGGKKDGMLINDTECINTSFPGFEGLLESIR
ncbi:MAG TPA: 3-phosphoshikimate 1-carboxyvinyltransferase [Nitrospirota bacterium]|nr:3-phosphoshikimate 1-carboxyvinyltransferase [Nitrospirota bacterium]